MPSTTGSTTGKVTRTQLKSAGGSSSKAKKPVKTKTRPMGTRGATSANASGPTPATLSPIQRAQAYQANKQATQGRGAKNRPSFAAMSSAMNKAAGGMGAGLGTLGAGGGGKARTTPPPPAAFQPKTTPIGPKGKI
jgi:hypothetical protein